MWNWLLWMTLTTKLNYTYSPIWTFRSSPLEVFLGKGVLKMCRKSKGEHLCNFIKVTLQHGFSPVNSLHEWWLQENWQKLSPKSYFNFCKSTVFGFTQKNTHNCRTDDVVTKTNELSAFLNSETATECVL